MRHLLFWPLLFLSFSTFAGDLPYARPNYDRFTEILDQQKNCSNDPSPAGQALYKALAALIVKGSCQKIESLHAGDFKSKDFCAVEVSDKTAASGIIEITMKSDSDEKEGAKKMIVYKRPDKQSDQSKSALMWHTGSEGLEAKLQEVGACSKPASEPKNTAPATALPTQR